MGNLDSAAGFGEQVAREDQDDGADDAEHADLGPLGLALAGLVELGEADVGHPQKAEHGDGQPEHQSAVLDVAFDQLDPVARRRRGARRHRGR
jgi:hypothetical protein